EALGGARSQREESLLRAVHALPIALANVEIDERLERRSMRRDERQRLLERRDRFATLLLRALQLADPNVNVRAFDRSRAAELAERALERRERALAVLRRHERVAVLHVLLGREHVVRVRRRL